MGSIDTVKQGPDVEGSCGPVGMFFVLPKFLTIE